MTWAKLAEVLKWEVAKLPETIPAPVPHSKVELDAYDEWLKELEEETQERIDAACLQFAASRSWPPLNLKEEYWLRARLLSAWRFAREMATSPLPNLARSKWPATLKWLLTEMWWRDGVDRCVTGLALPLSKEALRQQAPARSALVRRKDGRDLN